ncbi:MULTISPECIES: transcriptional repressor LexA [Halomonas]|uniref:LexA repressor n=3 Tax=Halomonas TaxID=2745 RepID=A0AAU7KNU4_9GAMM|nr:MULTISPECIES: transcriptional repressor LexA [Halomonas]MBR9772373.1 transcriptional repressor LexA [Gammaproteobacteria bacterium]MAR70920.1 repressor LexA [Halomonas sp.]MBS8269979.1 transcriptional repressor LexA [Halomonas litopenaei]MBY6112357.1 transcriptional repressor LexA [Halomonas sp. DP1Y21-3]MCJ8286899.1 transcriptional repressor LexA [Halomonas sp.]|tara:strand:- start:4265 stop:4930 length:666 start_codon:yes stop_codon:yes gene_type:complete
MTRPLTPRQQNVYDFIVKTMNELGYPPTRAEISRALGFRSPNAAEEHLRALERKGAIRVIRGTSRGIRLPAQEADSGAANESPQEASPSQGLPIIGEVAAGSPILAAEHIDRYCPLPPDYFTPRADYLLRVRGLSMKDVGILEGDLLAVHRTERIRNGQIVVARLEDEVTVKRFQRDGHQVTLEAENPDFAPITLDLRRDSLDIEGVGVGVIRGGNGQALG